MFKSLVPFEGGISEHVPNAVIGTYTCDKVDDGTVTYQFNSLGYRGDEPDPTKETIVVVGGSATFGIGVNVEDSWPYKFKELYEKEHNCEVNLLNFSHYNASNETIARRILAQLTELRPALLIADYQQISFKELFEGEGEPTFISPWDESETSELYYYFYNETNAQAETLNSMLLVQNFCETENIPLLCGWAQDDDAEALEDSINSVVQHLRTQIEWDCFYEHSYFNDKIYCDKSREGYHIGPETATLYATNLFETYKKRFQTKEQQNG